MSNFSNDMGELLEKIEMDNALDDLNLPEKLQKDKWINPIALKTIPTFSRFFPHKIVLELDFTQMKKLPNGYYLISDDMLPEGCKIIGAGDIAWQEPNPLGLSGYGSENALYGLYDPTSVTQQYGMEDLMLAQCYANEESQYNTNIFVEFEMPNHIRLGSALGGFENNLGIQRCKINMFVRHPLNLSTIEETKMETFENLATSDIARFLYNNLKRYDNLETVFSNSSLRLDDLLELANKREEIVSYMDENYISASNYSIPLMINV